MLREAKEVMGGAGGEGGTHNDGAVVLRSYAVDGVAKQDADEAQLKQIDE